MTRPASGPRRSGPPARQLRLLANWAPLAAAMFGLFTVWMVVSTLQNLWRVLTAPQELAEPLSAVVISSLVVGVLMAVLGGLVTYRLGVETPRTLRGWQGALADRTHALHEARGGSTSARER